jgi:hypothetical protein
MLISVRIALIVVALAAWFWSQKLIGSRSVVNGGIGDQVHFWTAGWNARLQKNKKLQNWLLVTSSAGIDILGIFLIIAGIFGESFRPFIGLLMLFGLRQVCQATTALPIPEGIIWHKPGVPSLLVTYGVSNDFFFSGHTAIAVFGAIEMVKILGFSWLPVAIIVAVYEIVVVLILRAHWTLDVITGIFAALLIALVCSDAAFWCDAMIAKAIG